MKVAVTGGAGFLGTNVVQRFGNDAIVVEKHGTWTVDKMPNGIDAVVHLAANADVRSGWEHPERDIKENLMLTASLLESMRRDGVRRLVFASTGSVYHPSEHFHTPACSVHATSLYAASKIAAEQLIAAYVAAGHIDATILRFVSVLGPHYSHGLILDFVAKLKRLPRFLEVLKPGTSKKSYIHVQDVVAAIDLVLRQDVHENTYEVLNVGTPDVATPIEIAEWVLEGMDLKVPIKLTGETWVGDNPTIRLDTSGLGKLGWVPQYSIEQAVKDTVTWLIR